jgi:hypothetical protein
VDNWKADGDRHKRACHRVETNVDPAHPTRAHNPTNDENRQGKVQETENRVVGSDDHCDYNDDDDDDDSFLCEEAATFKTVQMRMKKGDTAFQNAKYHDARKEYVSAWKHVDTIMCFGEEPEDDDADDDDDDDDFELEEPSVQVKEKCHKALSVVATKLGEYHAVRKEWEHVFDLASMALDHDFQNQDALYLLAKSQYFVPEAVASRLEMCRIIISGQK